MPVSFFPPSSKWNSQRYILWGSDAVEEPKSTEKLADPSEPMDTAQEENANADGKVNGVDKPSDNSEQTEPKDEPMNTDKEGIAAEKENQVCSAIFLGW